MKRLERIPARRNHIDVIEQGKVEIERWIEDEDMTSKKKLFS